MSLANWLAELSTASTLHGHSFFCTNSQPTPWCRPHVFSLILAIVWHRATRQVWGHVTRTKEPISSRSFRPSSEAVHFFAHRHSGSVCQPKREAVLVGLMDLAQRA
ncbi:unnamed protein product [Protopolystoma xenopodis]|uniref:Uncharacterized protein n=1 Tax=Protopolystoma xenopodis TaxID=117903 RepID=A0A448WPY9_9PLAT|nr:unnamed protein product [Protopolystoma xenopodis]